MSDPTFTTPPTAPQPSDSPEAFNTKAFSFFGWFATFVGEMGSAVPWFRDRASETQTASTAATCSKTAAATSETNAAASATAANTSKTNAATSATNAGNSATAAAGSATAADASKTAAGTSATNAANSATAANTSKIAAGTSETNAAASASAALASKNAAGTSETNAAASATAANASKVAAATSETNAAGSASSASASATAAGNAKTAAQQSAADAAASAAQAAGGGEPTILTSDANKYWDGTKTWRDFMTSVRASVLTGLSTASGAAVAATDTVLVAVGKLQKQISDAVAALGNKVDKDGSKVLSDNNYTTSEKSKLNDIQANAAAVGSTAGAALGTAAAGSATTAARSDHVHALPTPTAIGLGNVNNTSDANKPVSTAQQAALDLKANSVTPTLTAARGVVVALGAGSAINCSALDVATKTITGATTFSVTNVPAAGLDYIFRLEIRNGGAYSVAYWANLRWDSGIAPALTVSGLDVLMFSTNDGGANWVGYFVSKDAK